MAITIWCDLCKKYRPYNLKESCSCTIPMESGTNDKIVDEE